MLFKLAWRNIWRNKRRTIITAASIMFAVFFASFMEAIQKGAWNNMISNVVNFYYGYVQVHQDGYWEEQSLDKAFELQKPLQQIDEQQLTIRSVLPRIESFALASTGNTTMGGMVVGIDPKQEQDMTKLKDRLIKGAYLELEDQAVILAGGIADNLKIGIGDTVLLISQGYHGVNAAGKYPVKGIVEFGSPELNKRMIYLPLPEAQWFYGAEGMATSLAFHLKSPEDIPRVMAGLKQQLPSDEYEVMDWKQMMPDLVEAKTLDSAGNIIVYVILYIIISFGIFGTILMMTKEREYEFGILVSIGMRRWLLSGIVWLEVFLLGLFGSILGILITLPVVGYFKQNPIQFSGDYSSAMEKFGFEPVFPALFDWNIFFIQASVVIFITAVLALYPSLKINRLKPVDAMRA